MPQQKAGRTNPSYSPTALPKQESVLNNEVQTTKSTPNQQQHFTFTNQNQVTKQVSTPVNNPNQQIPTQQFNSRSQGTGIKMHQIAESGNSRGRSSTNGSKVRSFSQNQNNRKVIANFLNSNSMQLQNTTGFGGRNLKQQINSFDKPQHQENSSQVLAEKYSSLINKSVTSVGWTSGNAGQPSQPQNPLII